MMVMASECRQLNNTGQLLSEYVVQNSRSTSLQGFEKSTGSARIQVLQQRQADLANHVV